jgi:hypothetical protein
MGSKETPLPSVRIPHRKKGTKKYLRRQSSYPSAQRGKPPTETGKTPSWPGNSCPNGGIYFYRVSVEGSDELGEVTGCGRLAGRQPNYSLVGCLAVWLKGPTEQLTGHSPAMR